MIDMFLVIYVLTSVGILLVFSLRLYLAFKKFSPPISIPLPKKIDSVSVCIPARNEAHAMTDCLERVLASDYPKLEIIVFDDSSKDDTSVLIRSFAQSGVRFVPGTDLPDGWLGKNHALEVMAKEASGRYLLFLDVDTYIKPTTISQLISHIASSNLDMLSVMPIRSDGWRGSVLFGHLRYFWELIFSKSSAPASSSSLWIIKRDKLMGSINGFNEIKTSAAPEASLAARLSLNKYSCVISDQKLSVSYEKKWRSQLETSRRLLYPKFGPAKIRTVGAILLMAICSAQFFIILSSLYYGFGKWQQAAILIAVGFTLMYGAFTRHLWTRGWWLGAILWPIIINQELILLIASIIGYYRGSITWKGRRISARPANYSSYVIDK